MTPRHAAGGSHEAPDHLSTLFTGVAEESPGPSRSMKKSEKKKRSRRPEKPRRWRRIVIVLVVLALLLGGLAAVGAMFWNQFGDRISEALGWTSNDYEGEGRGEVVILITAGEIGEDVSRTLADAGVVKTSQAFYELLLEPGQTLEFHPGSYRLRLEMSAQAALDALMDPDNRLQLTAVIPEGKTVEQSLEIISVGGEIPIDELRAAAEDPSQFGLPDEVTSLEGWIYPASYEYDPDTSGFDALQRAVQHQIDLLDELGVAQADRERVLTIASMVEREAGRSEDFGKVATVIYNRLDAGMMLQMDSTAQYGMGQHEDGSVWSTDEALADDNPWNTYQIVGLPATPIANPGRAAIEATLAPESGAWLYFVAVNLDSGESAFTTNIDDHNRAVQQLSEWCVANPGRGC